MRTLRVLRDQKHRSIFIKSWGSLVPRDGQHGAAEAPHCTDRTPAETQQVGHLQTSAAFTLKKTNDSIYFIGIL